MHHQKTLIDACQNGDWFIAYDSINLPDVNIDDRGYASLKAAISSQSNLITDLLLNDSRTEPNHFDGQLFVDALKNLNIVKQFLSHPEFNLDTATIKDALLTKKYPKDIVALIFDDPRIMIDRQKVLPDRKLRINDVAAMDEDQINNYGITTQVRRLNDRYFYPTSVRQQHLAIDDLRYQLIVELYESNALDVRDQDALKSEPELFNLFKIDRFIISMTLNKGAVLPFDHTNRYHEAMLIILARKNNSAVLKSLLTSVPLRVAKEISFWKNVN